jgi:hypothetical protein
MPDDSTPNRTQVLPGSKETIMTRFLQIATLSAMFLGLTSIQANANSGGSKGSAGSHKSMSGSSHHNVSKT